MLASLAIAALGGVMAVFFANDDVMLRVMWTGFAAAFTALLMLPGSRLVDRQQRRPAGLYAMSVVLLLFLLAILLIWGDWLLTGRRDDQVGVTMAFLVPAAVVGTVLLRMMRSPSTALAGGLGLGLSALSFISLMIGTWIPRRSFFDEEWIGTGFTLAALGVVVATGLAGRCTTSRNLWRWAGVATGLVAAALILVAIWEGWVSESEKICVFFGTTTALASYSNLVLLVPLKPSQGWVRLVGLVSAGLTMILVNVIVFSDSGSDLLERSAAATGIVSACAAVALIVLAALNRRGDVAERGEDGVDVQISLVCPRCNHQQSLPVGDSNCKACNLRFHIRVEQPRCPNCEYLLYQLTSDRCPECGWEMGERSDAGV